MPRPRRDLQNEGLTRTQAAKLLRITVSMVRKLQADGVLRSTIDEGGVHRIRPTDVARYARRRGVELELPTSTCARVYEHFLAPGFRPTREAFARIVVATGEDPDVVLSLYEKFLNGPSMPDESLISRQYDEQIRAMDAELERRRQRDW
jgi:excisionase family DNA binding protein